MCASPEYTDLWDGAGETAISSESLSLNGGSIKLLVGVPADVTLPAPGQPGSLAANKDLAVHAVAPERLGQALDAPGVRLLVQQHPGRLDDVQDRGGPRRLGEALLDGGVHA